MLSAGACGRCREADKSNRLPDTASQIGDEVSFTTAIGAGHDSTDHTFHQCKDCGSVWVKYVDSGAGGHGRFTRRLTASLF